MTQEVLLQINQSINSNWSILAHFFKDGFRSLVGWVRVLGPTYSLPLNTQTLRLGGGSRTHAQSYNPKSLKMHQIILF